MSRVSQAARSARDNFCSAALSKLADACIADARDRKVGTALAPLASAYLFRSLSAKLDGPTPTQTVASLRTRLLSLLDLLVKSGTQVSDRFNHQVDDQLRDLADLIG